MAQERLHSPSRLPPAVSACSRGGRDEEADADDGDRLDEGSRGGCHWEVVAGVVQLRTCQEGGQGGREKDGAEVTSKALQY